MRKIISGAFALLLVIITSAQEVATNSGKPGGQTSFYAEVGGPGLVFSANIDKRFNKTHLGWGARASIGFASSYEETTVVGPGISYTSYENVSIVTFPLQVN